MVSPADLLTRRRMLRATATAAVAGLAGCTTAQQSPRTTTSHQQAGGGVGNGHGYTAHLQMAAVSPAAITQHVTLTVSTRTDYTAILRDLAQNGTTRVNATTAPLPTRRPIAYQGTVFNVSETELRHANATQYTVVLSKPSDTGTAGSDVIQYTALPAIDRKKLSGTGLTDGKPGVAATVVYANSERSQSALVPTPTHSVIEWSSGHRAHVTVKDATPTTLTTYQYSASKIQSVAAYGQHLRDQYGFTLSELSTAEAKIVKQAISQDNGYVVPLGTALPKAFRTLLHAFNSQRPVEDMSVSSVSGAYLVTYQGKTYWTTLTVQSAAASSSS